MAVTNRNFLSSHLRGVCNDCGTDVGDLDQETVREARKVAKRRHDQYVFDCAGVPTVFLVKRHIPKELGDLNE